MLQEYFLKEPTQLASLINAYNDFIQDVALGTIYLSQIIPGRQPIPYFGYYFKVINTFGSRNEKVSFEIEAKAGLKLAIQFSQSQFQRTGSLQENDRNLLASILEMPSFENLQAQQPGQINDIFRQAIIHLNRQLENLEVTNKKSIVCINTKHVIEFTHHSSRFTNDQLHKDFPNNF